MVAQDAPQPLTPVLSHSIVDGSCGAGSLPRPVPPLFQALSLLRRQRLTRSFKTPPHSQIAPHECQKWLI